MARYNFGTFNIHDQQYGDLERIEDQMYRPPAPRYNEGIQTLVNTYAPPTDIDAQAAKQVARAAQTNLPAQNLANQQANAFNQLLVNAGVIAPPEVSNPVEPPPQEPQEPPRYDPVYPEYPVYGVPDDYFYEADERVRDELINTPPSQLPLTPIPLTPIVEEPNISLNRPYDYAGGGLVKYSHGGLHGVGRELAEESRLSDKDRELIKDFTAPSVAAYEDSGNLADLIRKNTRFSDKDREVLLNAAKPKAAEESIPGVAGYILSLQRPEQSELLNNLIGVTGVTIGVAESIPMFIKRLITTGSLDSPEARAVIQQSVDKDGRVRRR